MSYSTNFPTHGLFAAPASPNAFALFASAHSPRETYHMYGDAREALRPAATRRQTTKFSLKRFLGL
ncbi:hypothetical protein C8Q76DRAFT_620037 [Earliella scabrosa]|nr:hypothetical protein C8Q76DRAFT_620037 [Earliella scabrosa]